MEDLVCRHKEYEMSVLCSPKAGKGYVATKRNTAGNAEWGVNNGKGEEFGF